MINHASHSHPATSAARAACRKAMAAAEDKMNLVTFLRIMDSGYCPTPNHWTFYAARRFAGYQGNDPFEAAQAVITHFAPSGDDAKDLGRRRNGWIITTDFHQIRSITLRAAS